MTLTEANEIKRAYRDVVRAANGAPFDEQLARAVASLCVAIEPLIHEIAKAERKAPGIEVRP